jgi:hypothetical protein
MIGVQRAIFPGIFVGCIFIVFITGLIAKPGRSLDHWLSSDGLSQGVFESSEASGDLPQTASQVSLETEVQPEQPGDAASTTTGSEGIQNGCSLNPSYPEAILQWCGLIDRYAEENDLDPNLVASVMLQESGGNPNAYSKSGAVGLMQVMPRDGLAANFNCINGPCFTSRPSMEELYDPEFNIQYGVSMLAGLIRKYDNVREGLRAYGPMNYGYRYADIILDIMARYE